MTKAVLLMTLLVIENINLDSLLFVGNELFAGGNDDPVRRVEGITILSVGEKEDPGVIDGGIQVEANQYWMSELTASLDEGESWPDILLSLPDNALSVGVRKKIDIEKSHAHKISEWHDQTGKKISTDILLDIYLKYGNAFKQTRESLLKVKNTQYELVKRLAVLEKYHYDNARKIVMQLLGNHPPEEEKNAIKDKIKQFLMPEIKDLLKLLLIDHLHLNEKQVSEKFNEAIDLITLRDAMNRLIERAGVKEIALEFERKNKLIENWNEQVDDMVDTYFNCLCDWKQKLANQFELIESDNTINKASNDVPVNTLCDYFRWLVSRIDNYPHLKDLDKPTIILVAGTSGVGKSTVSHYISKTMGIPTAFSSDVASRSVVRETISFLLGRERAEQLFPEVSGSSFEQENLEWFYAHSLMTMVGVTGNITRLIKENISAVIDGVALIPGTLPELLFEKANIVWLVACVGDREAHFERLGTRSETGVERGGADRYRDQFSAIRQNHDRLVEMAERTNTLIVDNSGSIDEIFSQVLERVSNPLADRGLYVDDRVRDQVQHQLHERSTWDIQNMFDQDKEDTV